MINKRIIKLLNTKSYFLILILITGFLFLFKLGSSGFREPDEARYAEIPREMIATGDFITPHLNYVKYFEKPILSYWITALSFKIFGFTEFAGRFPSALFGLGTVILTFFLAKKIYGELTAFLAGIILATNILFFALARILIIDMPLSFFMTATFTFFYLGFKSLKEAKPQNYYFYLFYIFMALAVLTKGLIGIILPLGVLFWFLLLTKNFKELKNLKIIAGIFLFLLVSVPWFYLVCKRNSEFFYFFFVREHFLRYLTKEHHRQGPLYYYLIILLAGFFPYVVFLLNALLEKFKQLKQSVKNNEDFLFLFLWFFIIFLFFSISQSKLPTYILPTFPALSIIVANFLVFVLKNSEEKFNKLEYFSFSFLLLLVGLILIALIYLPIKKFHLIFSQVVFSLFPVIIVFGVWLIFLIYCLIFSKKNFAFKSIFVFSILMLLTLTNCLKLVEPYLTVKSLALLIKKELKPQDKIINYNLHQQTVSFYTGRRLIMIGDKNELEFGSKIGNNKGYFYDNENDLINFLKTKERVFVLSDKNNFKRINNSCLQQKPIIKLHLLANSGKIILFSNKANKNNE